jgi:hypothetical protein
VSAAKRKRPKSPKHVPSPVARRQAKQLAERMPLVHFPAAATFTEWSTKWGHHLRRPADRKKARADRFGALCDNHVFFYAGPCCYQVDNSQAEGSSAGGNAAMYFAPGLELGRTGSVTPFDSGALEPSPHLQPFRHRGANEDQLWRFFCKHERSLDDWRDMFAAWLAHCYDDPTSYVESTMDRHAAGQPDRTTPNYLLQHNGTRGVARYGREQCGDRRTWTWEIRVEQPVSMDDIALLHVGFNSFASAHAFADDIEARTGRRPLVRTLPVGVEASDDNLYEDSSNILREMMQP